MRENKSFAKQNKGSALIAVLIILTFVSVVALIITKITMTNIEMKEVQSSTRKNFYNTEDIMDMMKSGLSKISAEAVKESYADVLGKYSIYTSEGKNLQEQFQKEYLEKIEEKFWDSNVAKNTSTEDLNPEQKLYTTAKYKIDVVKNCIAKENVSDDLDAKRECFKTSESDAKYELDYKKGVFILKNIKVTQEDSSGYGTEIKTDIVFEAPKIAIDKKFQTAAFMKYALIADDKINASAANIKVSGNVYAGVNGIKSSEAGSNVTFTGDTIVTRGDIVSDNGASLTMNGGNTSDAGIWAQNIKTTGDGSKFSISGNSYIADDLSLDGMNSNVKLSGVYYGYNFQKNYGEKENDKTNDAAYNSSIIINGKNSTLDMKSLNVLRISGRTFISRGSSSSGNSDIAMGESLAVRTNQLAYYVPVKYLDENSDDSAKKFTADGLKEYEKAVNISDIKGYLDTKKQVVAYYYVVNELAGLDKPFVNYYLNFKTEQKANEFFEKYYKANKSTVNANANIYASKDALIVDKNKILTLGGNILYREKADSQLEQKVALSTESADWDKDGAEFKESANYAKKYKALQLGLTTTHEGVTDDNVRITKDNKADEIEDKTQSSLFSYIVNEDRVRETVDANGDPNERVCIVKDEQETGSTSHKVVVIADNKNNGTTYELPTNYNEGIIIATGDVKVDGSFKGLILSGGKIDFAANANVTSDEVLVSNLLQDVLNSDIFAGVINEDTYLDSGSLGGVEIVDYISYENWKKNEE